MTEFDKDKPCQRVYGSFQWAHSIKLPDKGLTVLGDSPPFVLGGFLWSLHVRAGEEDLGIFLVSECPQPPSVPIDCQLWIADQKGHAATQATVLKAVVFKDLRVGKGQGYGVHKMMSYARLLGDSRADSTTANVIAGVHLKFNQRAAQESTAGLDHFASLYDDGKFSDVLVQAGEVIIKAHKAVLAAHSAMFKAMLTAGMKEQMSGKVNLPLHNEQVLQPLLSFMYGKLEEVPDKLLLPLFQAADYYQVPPLRAMCLVRLIHSLSVRNVLDYILVADSCSETNLKDACLSFTEQNSAEVAELPGMEQLMSTRPALAHKLMITMTAAARASKKRKAETAKPS